MVPTTVSAVNHACAWGGFEPHCSQISASEAESNRTTERNHPRDRCKLQTKNESLTKYLNVSPIGNFASVVHALISKKSPIGDIASNGKLRRVRFLVRVQNRQQRSAKTILHVSQVHDVADEISRS
jgi:hypothetical protein